MLRNAFYKMLNLQKGEFVLLLCSFIFMFLIFASYGILRPVRDALGLENGSENLKWLFLATFVTMIVFSLLAMWLSGFVKRKLYIDCIFVFFTLNLLCFYVAMRAISDTSPYFIHLSSVFYVWVSVFSLFIISSAWSLLVDLYSKERSQRLFGIIIAGVSLGGIAGASAVNLLTKFNLQIHNFILISMLLLALALVFKHFIVSATFKLLSKSDDSSNPLGALRERFSKPIGSKNPLAGFSLIIKSPYLMTFMGFILLLTSVSTFLYLEQSRVIEELFPKNMEGYKEMRASIFASIDFIVQSVSFVIQFFLTSRIVKYIGLKWLLSSLGVVIAFGFVWLAFVHSTPFPPAEPYILSIFGMDFTLYLDFLPIAVVMSIRRIGEYALIRPGREMLFVPLDSESKYKVKNFIDTVVYRAGDSLSAQVEGAIAKVSVVGVLFVGAGVSLAWSALGWYLGKRYEKEKR
ncbi:MFS transporter [Helicobacter sp. MIT 00-7814]|uniref:NTP/NDP exchange transporter n=1 Tax=unclassified Helicobacter TaxID=2593540 RepID=UPI000E1F079A|nr:MULTISPECIES: MFS transporter [unclassified Helicobacter]RDU57113.1 MFS transporter [Helicobacter sp. MIT 00-7814]RDU57664.1 MFS transporter [Helicobacter sp. MIT 99-10781]